MEAWKNIARYEGHYQISNLGNVRSLDRVVKRHGMTAKKLKSKTIKVQKYNNGYCKVCLCKDGIPKEYLLHRLVAKAFLSNTESKSDVNHINEDKSDNRASNLEWATHRENAVHGTQLQRGVKNRDQSGSKNGMYGRTGSANPHSKRIIQLDLQGNFIREYECIKEAAVATGSNPSAISGAAKGRLRQTNGYMWQYKNESYEKVQLGYRVRYSKRLDDTHIQ